MFALIAENEAEHAAAKDLSQGVVELEKKLSAISMDEEDANDPLVSYKPTNCWVGIYN